MNQETEDYSKTVTFKKNKIIGSITINHKTLPNHGAPSSIDFKKATGISDADEKTYWKALRDTNEELNRTSDKEEKNKAECRSDYIDSGDKANHVFAGGEGTIDSISPENLKNVAAKTLRILQDQKIISNDEMKQAYAELDLPRKTIDFLPTQTNRVR